MSAERLRKRLDAKLKAQPNGCIEWQGNRLPRGYGRISVGPRGSNREWLVHRLVWTLARGDIPDGQMVCHTCDNPSCANIEHLFLGSQHDNMGDAAAKRRTAWGEKQGQSRLTADIVRWLRVEWEAGATIETLRGRLIEMHGLDMSFRAVWAAVIGESWAYLDE